MAIPKIPGNSRGKFWVVKFPGIPGNSRTGIPGGLGCTAAVRSRLFSLPLVHYPPLVVDEWRDTTLRRRIDCFSSLRRMHARLAKPACGLGHSPLNGLAWLGLAAVTCKRIDCLQLTERRPGSNRFVHVHLLTLPFIFEQRGVVWSSTGQAASEVVTANSSGRSGDVSGNHSGTAAPLLERAAANYPRNETKL